MNFEKENDHQTVTICVGHYTVAQQAGPPVLYYFTNQKGLTECKAKYFFYSRCRTPSLSVK